MHERPAALDGLSFEQKEDLKPYLAAALAIAYQLGQDLAVQEPGLDYSTFPLDCPHTLIQILDPAFFPNP